MRLRHTLIGGLSATLVAVSGIGFATAQANAGQRQQAPQSAPAVPPEIPSAEPMKHLAALQKIADENGGTRAHGRPGFKASADYIKKTLDDAGFQTSLQSFTYQGATGYNVLAEWPHGDANDVVMIGAHLDSVTAGPGINDDGSGTAAVLSNALAVAKADLRPTKRMRFGWWGAEEIGLIGSKHYVQTLSAAEKSKIKYYLNFDMVGYKASKTWGIYNHSPEVSAMWKRHLDAKQVSTKAISWNGSSDHSSFASAGIKVSGIGVDEDPNYHTRGDTISNVGDKAIGISTNAIADVFWQLAGA
ncbi:M28 family peptidase [Pilimelia columellifera]|uniref:M28 family metallopeptidase n=1 Tax=Pilimelia columellifera subsp. columellifera TaxID=706583 RepID=A0ABN3NDE2_9ACTN